MSLEKQHALEIESAPPGLVSHVRRSPPRRVKIIAVIMSALLLSLGLAVGIVIGERLPQGHLHSVRADSLRFTKRAVTWQPTVGSTWNLQLYLPPTLSQLKTPAAYQVWDIDLFDTPKSTITTIQAAGSKVICYFSAGSYEPDRPDSRNFTAADMGSSLDGWPGEQWLKLSSANVRKIMKARLDLAVSKGCNGVDPDNIDGYDNDNGIGLTESDSIDYMKFLAAEAAIRGMSIGLKNAASIIDDLLPVMQWSVNEQCSQYQECIDFQPFIIANKPVFNVEYPKGDSRSNNMNVTTTQYNRACKDPDAPKFSKIIKNINLNEWIQKCT